MLGRLISWCVPDSSLELRANEVERSDLGQALAPYESETAEPDVHVGLRIVGNS